MKFHLFFMIPLFVLPFHAMQQQLPPLHQAAKDGNLPIVQGLVQNGANINAQTNYPKRKKNGDHSFKAVTDIMAYGLYNATPLHIAAAHGHLLVVQWLVRNSATIDALTDNDIICTSTNATPLHLAASAGHLDVVKCLVTKKAYVNALTYNRDTPLNLATKNDHFEVVQYLVQSGAHIEGTKGRIPLHSAADNGNLDIVRCLVQNGANINALDGGHWTPLHYAIRGGNFEVIKYLVQNNADINALNKYKATPLDFAVLFNSFNIVRFLALHGANFDKTHADTTHNQEIRNYLNAMPAIISLLASAKANNMQTMIQAIAQGAGINVEDLNGNTPLHYAAQHGNWQAILYLLTHGADPSIENYDHESPIQVAVRNKHFNILGLFVMAAAGNQQQTHDFSQYMANIIDYSPRKKRVKRN